MILVATVGTGKYGETEYYFETSPERTSRTCYGPVATAELAGEVTDALILLTKEAEQAHWVPLRQQLESRGIRAQKLEIPMGRTEAEHWQVVGILNERIVKGAELILDITHALRHLPVLMLTSLTYLTGERDVKIRGIYYGAYEARIEARTPIFNLTPFLTLTDCYHAIRQFRETGDARRLVQCLKDTNAALWQRGEKCLEFSKLTNTLKVLSTSLVAALPLETGFHSRHALTYLAASMAYVTPKQAAAASLVQAVAPTLGNLAFGESPQDKACIALNLEEIERQLRVIRFCLASQAYDRALLLLREWIVNRCLLADGKCDAWLDYRLARKPMEAALNSLSERIQSHRSGAAPAQVGLTSLWQRIASLRNRMAHAGMCPDEINPESENAKIEAMIAECEQRSGDDQKWKTCPQASVRSVLVTPLGLSPGVLFTALVASPAERVLVLSSREGALQIAEICERAGFDSSQIRVEIVENPHRCFQDADRLVPGIRPLLLAAGEVTINITGGTTALQYLVEKIGREAERLGIGVRRIALVDARPYAEQKEKPYVAGDVVVLDSVSSR